MTNSADQADACSPTFAEHARQQFRLLKIGLIAVLVLGCAIPFSINVADPDLWGHVRYGQDWLAAGEMPRTATHTFTAVDYPWVNHENAAELTYALAYEHLGIQAMLVLKCLLGLGIMATMAWAAGRRGVPAVASWSLLLLVAANLQPFFPMRPQLFSFALCTITLVCFERAFAGWETDRVIRFRWLWPLPLIMVAWVNSHGGFMAGLCIIGAYLLGRMIELIIAARAAKRTEQNSLGASSALRSPASNLIRLAIIGLATLAATVVNPYGFGMHEWLYHAWGGAPPEITEWAAPKPSDPNFWSFVTLLVIAVASLAGSRRRRDWTQIVILALVTWQSCLHLRHIAFVALLIGFWLPVHWHSALVRLLPDRSKRLPIVLPPRWLRAAMAGAILLCIGVQSTALARRLAYLPVLRSQYPVDAIQYMVDHRLQGKLVVAFNWAQYALAALAPDVTVGFDGRFDTCYPQEAIDVHFDFLLGDQAGPRERDPASGPMDPHRVLDYYDPDMVLIERRYKNCTSVMQAEAARPRPEWTLLYSDSVSELWGRTSRYNDPSSPHYLPTDARRHDVRLLEASFQWPAMPDRSLWEAPIPEASQSLASIDPPLSAFVHEKPPAAANSNN